MYRFKTTAVVVVVAAVMAENTTIPRDLQKLAEIPGSSVSRRRLPAIPRLEALTGNRVGRSDCHRRPTTEQNSANNVGSNPLESFVSKNDNDPSSRRLGSDMRRDEKKRPAQRPECSDNMMRIPSESKNSLQILDFLPFQGTATSHLGCVGKYYIAFIVSVVLFLAMKEC